MRAGRYITPANARACSQRPAVDLVDDAEHASQLAAEVASLREERDVIDRGLCIVSGQHADRVESLGLLLDHPVDRRTGHQGAVDEVTRSIASR